MKPYIIYGSKYNRSSNGQTVLHELSNQLEKRGYKAYITKDNMLVKDLKLNDGIAVYPERVSGNPLNCKTVVRYLLHKNGYFDGKEAIYGKHDLLFTILERYHKEAYPLFISAIEMNIFNDWGLDRDKSCYFIGKHFKNGERDTEMINKIKKNIIGDVEITSNYPVTRYDLAYLFNKCRLFYCYDSSTDLVNEARLCGCAVVFMAEQSDGFMSKGDMISNYKGNLGFAYGSTPDNIQNAFRTIKFFRNAYTEKIIESENQLLNFINLTQV